MARTGPLPISTGMTTPAAAPLLTTSIGDFALSECRLGVGGKELAVLHTAAVLSLDEETRFLNSPAQREPYGVVLWPAAIALAHEIATRAAEFRRKTVLELGAGTGLPGLAVPVGSHGNLRTGVQIIPARFREDLALDAGEIIEAAEGVVAAIDPMW